MKIIKAVITAAGKGQRNLPLQTLIDRDGQQKSVLSIIVEEVVRAGIKDICIIIHPDDKGSFQTFVFCVPERTTRIWPCCLVCKGFY
jgi:UTP--glucose-1-phosphate uridylyltransferase